LRALYWQAVLDQEMSSLAGAGETGVSEVASVADPVASEIEIADTGNLNARPPGEASAVCGGQKADSFNAWKEDALDQDGTPSGLHPVQPLFQIALVPLWVAGLSRIELLKGVDQRPTFGGDTSKKRLGRQETWLLQIEDNGVLRCG
jgi:hypothetical protein